MQQALCHHSHPPAPCSWPSMLGSPRPAPLMLPPSTQSLRLMPVPGSRCCFLLPPPPSGALLCCTVHIKAPTPYGDSPGVRDRCRALFRWVRTTLRQMGCSAELRKGMWRLVYSVKVQVNHHGISASPGTVCQPRSQPHLPAQGVPVHGCS